MLPPSFLPPRSGTPSAKVDPRYVREAPKVHAVVELRLAGLKVLVAAGRDGEGIADNDLLGPSLPRLERHHAAALDDRQWQLALRLQAKPACDRLPQSYAIAGRDPKQLSHP